MIRLFGLIGLIGVIVVVIVVSFLIGGDFESYEIGDTVEVANSGGVCGEYMGWKGAVIVRDAENGELYAFSAVQPAIRVDGCN
mgnify:FL=1|jgi:uncharacterized protein (UPF0333 family)